MRKINLNEKFSRFQEHWTPYIVAEMNGQQVKVAKVSGEFVWHDHAEEDELFLIQKGTLFIDFRDGTTTELNAGELCVVPRGVEHRPWTRPGEEAWIVLLEPASTKHTGEVVDALTKEEHGWL